MPDVQLNKVLVAVVKKVAGEELDSLINEMVELAENKLSKKVTGPRLKEVIIELFIREGISGRQLTSFFEKRLRTGINTEFNDLKGRNG